MKHFPPFPFPPPTVSRRRRLFLFKRQSPLFEWQREAARGACVWGAWGSSCRSVIRREPGAARYGGGQRGEEADDGGGSGGRQEGGRRRAEPALRLMDTK